MFSSSIKWDNNSSYLISLKIKRYNPCKVWHMRCTQLLLIVDYEVITVIIITVLIKYPVLSSKTLSTISLLYLEGSVRDAINLPVVFSVQITCSSCTYHWPCFGFLFFSFSLPHSAVSLWFDFEVSLLLLCLFCSWHTPYLY